jgi:hypothetical protein
MATGHGTNRTERERLPRWRSVRGSSCGTAASTDLGRTCNGRESQALGVETLITRGEHLGQCPYRLSVYSSVGRVEGAQSDAAPIVQEGHRVAPQERAGDGGEERERREGNAKTAGWDPPISR